MQIKCQECDGRGVYESEYGFRQCRTCSGAGKTECPCETNQKQLAEKKQKTRWDLVPWAQIEGIAEIITLGAPGHGENTWKEESLEHQFAAILRHISAWRRGEKCSDDMGRPHLLHAATRLIFAAAIEEENA